MIHQRFVRRIFAKYEKNVSEPQFQISILCAENTRTIGRNSLFSSHIGNSRDKMGK